MNRLKDTLRQQGRQRIRVLLEKAGGCLTHDAVADRLRITRDAVEQLTKERQLILVELDEVAVFPVFQFEKNKIVTQLPEIVAMMHVTHQIDVINFLLGFESDLGDTPMNALREGKQWALVTRLARQYGVQGAR